MTSKNQEVSPKNLDFWFLLGIWRLGNTKLTFSHGNNALGWGTVPTLDVTGTLSFASLYHSLSSPIWAISFMSPACPWRHMIFWLLFIVTKCSKVIMQQINEGENKWTKCVSLAMLCQRSCITEWIRVLALESVTPGSKPLLYFVLSHKFHFPSHPSHVIWG